MKYKHRYMKRWPEMLLCLLVLWFAVFWNLAALFGWLGVAIGGMLLMGLVAVYVVYWRCPDCEGTLPLDGAFSTSFCPHCGRRIFPE